MSALLQAFQPLWDALFCRGLEFNYRWRLLTLVPINVLAHSVAWLPWVFSRAYSVTRFPLKRSPGTTLRALVFRPAQTTKTTTTSPGLRLRPLHIDIHGGGFTGGIPEIDAPWCDQLSRETGAVVVSITYRVAPRYTFPTAHEDVQDITSYVLENAEQLWGADPKLLTISGFSAGANLALGVAQHLSGTPHEVTASVTFDNVVDLRLSPWQKPKPPGFPKRDPLFFVLPLFDTYVNKARKTNLENPLMNPILADIRTLPKRMLFMVPELDILLDESSKLVDRLKREADILNGEDGERITGEVTPQQTKYQVEALFFEGQLHGWLQLPSGVVDEGKRKGAFKSAVDFIRAAHRAHGWDYHDNV